MDIAGAPGQPSKFPVLWFVDVSADSQLSGFAFTLNSGSPQFTFDPEADTSSSPLKGWSISVTEVTDGIRFEATAPAGVYYEQAAGPPAELALFSGWVDSSATPGTAIPILLSDVVLTKHGVAEAQDDSLAQDGEIKVEDGFGPPPPDGEGDKVFGFTDIDSAPDSVFNIDFVILQPIPADSQLSRIRAEFRVVPPYVTWDSSGHKLAERLTGWTLDVITDADSLAIDLQAPADSSLSHAAPGDVLFTLAGRVDASAPADAMIMVEPMRVFLTLSGAEREEGPDMVRPGRIKLGDAGGEGPPPPPPPPVATGVEGRKNLGLYGGQVLDMAFDEVNGIVLAAVAAPQSVFISADSGLTWMPAFETDSLEFITGSSVRGFGGRAMQVESSEGYSYARTSQEAGTLTGSQVSEDGMNWRTLLDPYMAGNLLRAEFGNSTNPGPMNIASLAARGPLALVGAGEYVFRTTDAGITWDISQVPPAGVPGEETSVKELGVRADDSTGASFYVIVGAGFNPGGGGFYRTEDGETFTQIFVTLGSDTAEAVMSLAVHPQAGDTLWVSAVSPANQAMNGVYRSYDAGDTWTRVYELSGAGFLAPSVTLYQDSAYPGPDNLRLFLVGADEYSDDLGDSWTKFVPLNDPSSSRVSAANAALGHIPGTDVYFSQGDGAPARSTDGLEGSYAFVPTGMEGITIWDIAQVPNEMDKVYLATSVGIAYTSKFTDTTLTSTAKWAPPYGNYPINPPNGGNTAFTAIAIDPENTSHVVAANGNGIFVTENGGFDNEDWSATAYGAVSGLDEPLFKSQGGRIGQISFITSDSVIAAAYCERTLYGALLLSTDGGKTWAVMAQAGTYSYRTVVAAWNAAQDSLVLFAGGGGVVRGPAGVSVDSGAVFKSLDWGATWTRTALSPNGTFNPAPYPLPVNELAVKQGSLDTLYLACGENLSNAIVRSFDGGHTLESISMAAIGPREGAFEAVAINKNNADSVYFAIRRDILVYDAAADTATTLFRGYPGELTHALLYDDLTMGSSSGFYEIEEEPAVTTGVSQAGDNLPNSLVLDQNYPNPFNPSTRIHYTLPMAAKVKLAIYNVLGQRIEVLIDARQDAGGYEVLWQPQRLGSGVYFYKLQVEFENGTVQTRSKKLMLLR